MCQLHCKTQLDETIIIDNLKSYPINLTAMVETYLERKEKKSLFINFIIIVSVTEDVDEPEARQE
jgi:hypothetical protein